MIDKLNGSLSHLSPKSRDLSILATSLVIGLLFYTSFWNQLPGLSIGIFTVLTVFILWSLLTALGQNWTPSVWFITIGVLILTFIPTFRSAPWLTLLNLAASFGLALLMVWLLRGEAAFMPFIRYAALILQPFFWIGPFATALIRILQPSKNTESTILSPTLKGIIMAIPVVFILFYLFSRTDAVIASIFNRLFAFELSGEFALKWFIVLFVSAWFAAAIIYILGKGKKQYHYTTEQRILGFTESNILLIAVNATFGIFLLLQSVYLFGGESYLNANSLTYAQYARNGFGELILVSFIAGGLLFLTRPGIILEAKQIRLRHLGALLGLQVLLVLSSAMQRVWLYEQAYGFTVARLLSQALMVLLSLIFIVVIAQIYQLIQSQKVGAIIVGLIMVTLLGLNLLNPEKFITLHNINRYHQTGKIDIDYLGTLSEDAIPSLLPLLDDKNTGLSPAIARQLYDRLQELNRNSETHNTWQSFNVSRWQAYEELLKNQSRIEPYKSFEIMDNPSWQD